MAVDLKFSFSYYITGILILIEPCWVGLSAVFFCPFGYSGICPTRFRFQEVQHQSLKWLRYVKYGILIVMVWALPVLLQMPWGMEILILSTYARKAYLREQFSRLWIRVSKRRLHTVYDGSAFGNDRAF